MPSAFASPNRIQTDELHVADPSKPEPYLCMGFKIKEALVYLSDVSLIPEDIWEFLMPKNSDDLIRIPVLVLDCLRIKPHPSHFGLKQSVEVVRRFKARQSYLVGFTHDMTQEEYTEILRSVEGKQDLSNVSSDVRQAIDLIDGGESQWVRPAFDGLRLFISMNGSVREDQFN